MTVQELDARMLESEFLEWWAFYQREPWGDARLDIHFGHALACFANAPRKFREFMVRWGWRTQAEIDEPPEIAQARRIRERFQAFKEKHNARRAR
jgi:hypothetical protein